MPGSGEAANGNWGLGAVKAGYELGSFAGGYILASQHGIASLDGIEENYKPFNRLRRNKEGSVERELYSNILLEFALKSHMTNTFIAYRDAYAANGVTEGLDQHQFVSGFEAAFDPKSFESPWVYVPLMLVGGALAADYILATPDSSSAQPLNASSNFLFAAHYGAWEPLGSGWPEEAFYRGYLLHEFKTATRSPAVAILAQAALFAFSHAPGNGRYGAFAVGSYLGFLEEKFNGDLTPGITVHFWGGLMLGLETILIAHKNQRTTPPTGLGVQFDF